MKVSIGFFFCFYIAVSQGKLRRRQHQQSLRIGIKNVLHCNMAACLTAARAIIDDQCTDVRQNCFTTRFPNFGVVGGAPQDTQPAAATDLLKCNFKSTLTALETCHDGKIHGKNNKKAVSRTWCPAAPLPVPPAGTPGAQPPAPWPGAAANYETYWAHLYRTNRQNMGLTKFGVKVTLKPWGNHEFVPPNPANKIPNPTACRKYEDTDPRKNYISNTYIATFKLVAGGGEQDLSTPSQIQVRHGVFGFVHATPAVVDDFAALVQATGGPQKPLVSINLLSDRY